ncbi:MAG: hypothetical protein H7333_12205, partial [Bdellovibrionales bacterium]|nr:hypothetical protein [Oligoflexia bacterium]
TLPATAQEVGRDQAHRFPSFKHQNGMAVFTDFLKAEYTFTYDAQDAETQVQSEIEFDLAEDGYPVFDLVAEPSVVILDGASAQAALFKTPDEATTLRVLSRAVPAGRHHLSIRSPLTRLNSALNGFFMDDSVERFFLERYVPASFEYDHVKIIFNVSFKNFKTPWKIYANGNQTRNSDQSVRVEFPEYLTCSGLYFHALPADFVKETRFGFKSSSGKLIPVVTYVEPNQTSVAVSAAEVTEDLQKLESLYGPFPHESLTLYFGRAHVDHFNDMEYSGASITTGASLYHELSHSYFARGVMPANGNANWIDEAIADWTEGNLQTTTDLPARAKLASLPEYARYCWNIREAYGMSSFLGNLNGRYKIRGFLKYWGQVRFGQSVTTEEFIQDMEAYTGASLKREFEQRVY